MIYLVMVGLLVFCIGLAIATSFDAGVSNTKKKEIADEIKIREEYEKIYSRAPADADDILQRMREDGNRD